MHHNLNVSVERSGSTYVGHIELSTSGTANRASVTADSFDGIQAVLKEKHDEFLKAAESFHGAPPMANITHPSEAKARQVDQVPAAPIKTKGSRKGGKKSAAKAGAKGLKKVRAAREKNAKALTGVPDLLKGDAKTAHPKAAERKFASE